MAEMVQARIGELVAAAQADGRAPCVIAGVVRDGELIEVSSAGVDPVLRQPPSIDTQFRIGSITKTMTAALIMQLRDGGHLALDDPLYRHLPDTPVGSAVTLRQLLGHVSGLQREPDGDWWERSDGAPLDELLTGLTPNKIAYPPLRGYHYSNLGYGLLGAVLTRITETSWPDLIKERLCRPLGMARTSYAATEPFARGYVVHPWYDTLREEPRTDTRAMAPAGQLWSTVQDLARWAAFLCEPDPRVLAPDTLREMCAPMVISDPDAWRHGHGLGLELFRRGERLYVGHGGSMPGYRAHLSVHRPSRTAVVVYASAYSLRGHTISDLSLDIMDAVLDAAPARPPAWTPAPPDLGTPEHELGGSWWCMGLELIVGWDPERGELLLRPGSRPDEVWRCTRESADVWRCYSGTNDGERVLVRRGADGCPVALDIATLLHTRQP